MANIFDKWNKEMNVEQLAKDVAELEANSDNFDEKVPHGKYEGYIKEMEIKETKKGDPMLAIQFKIVDGKYKNKVLFVNFLLKENWQIRKSNAFLRSLDTEVDVMFEDYPQYNNLVNDIFDFITDKEYDHLLEYTENSNGYDEYKILEVYKA